MGSNSLDLETLSTPDEMASSIFNQHEEWRLGSQGIRSKWDEVESYLFATSTRETTNSESGGFSSEEANRNGWSHSTHNPKLTNIRDLLSAQYDDALFGTEDWLQYQGFDREAVLLAKRQHAESYVKTKWRLSGADRTMQTLIDDWIDTGNAFAFVDYVSDKTQDDSEEMFLPGYTGSVVNRINPRDIQFNILAPVFDKAPKIIRTVKTVAELHRDAEDHPELGYSHEILDLITRKRLAAGGIKAEEIDKHKQIHKCGFGSASLYLKSPYVEILEYYGDMMFDGEFLRDRVITVVDGAHVLRNQPTHIKIRQSVWRRRRDNLMGMGPLENIVGLQYMLNHLSNAFADVLDESLIPTTIKIGDMEATGYDKFGGLLNTEYTSLSGEGKIDFSRPDASILQANLGLDQIKNEMEVMAGAPRELGGIKTPGEKTATEVNALQTGAFRMFNNKTISFQKDFLEPLVNDFLALGRKYFVGSELVSTKDPDLGIEVFQSITKEDLTSNGQLVPVGARHFIQRNKFLQEAANFSQMLTADPELAQHFSSVRMAEMLNATFDIDNFKIFEPYIRITERQEAASMTQTAAGQVAQESAIPTDGGPIQPIGGGGEVVQ